MTTFDGNAISWEINEGCAEVALHRAPCNEIGTETLAELEILADALVDLEKNAHSMIIYSRMAPGFCAGADLRELYFSGRELGIEDAATGVRSFLERIHKVLNAIDSSRLTTIAAVHGVCFGGGFELALVCDLIIADKMSRFCFPELRLGLIPGFGGIPRLRRDLGNAVVRDLLLTGRSLNVARAHAVGLVSQVAAEGESLKIARMMSVQIGKFDRLTSSAAKGFIKSVPYTDLRREVDLFCELYRKPAVQAGLQKFVESTDAHPYLP